MTAPNLERAKAICKSVFDCQPYRQRPLTPGAKMEACMRLALEFHDEVWMSGKRGNVIVAMLKTVVEEKYEGLPQYNASAARVNGNGRDQNPALYQLPISKQTAGYRKEGESNDTGHRLVDTRLGRLHNTLMATGRQHQPMSGKEPNKTTNPWEQPWMTEVNLARAKAVCSLKFDGPLGGWAHLSMAEKMKALWEIGLEFQEEEWAVGKMGAIYRSMVDRILEDHHRAFHKIQKSKHVMDAWMQANVQKEPRSVRSATLFLDKIQANAVKDTSLRAPIRATNKRTTCRRLRWICPSNRL
jgi:hypothetical protein